VDLWCIFYLVVSTSPRGEIVTIIYFLLCALLVISYTYRHFLLALYFRSVLSDDLMHEDSSSLCVYRFPSRVSEKNYFCKTFKGPACLLPVGNPFGESILIAEKVGALPFLRYFIYSTLVFLMAILFSLNSFILSIFFKISLVKRMLFIFPWLHRKVFVLFFGEKFFYQSEKMVLF